MLSWLILFFLIFQPGDERSKVATGCRFSLSSADMASNELMLPAHNVLRDADGILIKMGTT